MSALALASALLMAGSARPEAQPIDPIDSIDVEQIARDELAAIEAIGVDTSRATLHFVAYDNMPGGGTGWADQREDDLTTDITMSNEPRSYLSFSSDVELAIRSTVRHEFGHAIAFWLYPIRAEEALAPICLDRSVDSIDSGYPGSECAAEAISEALSRELGSPRVRFYDLDISEESVTLVEPMIGAFKVITPLS